MYTNARLTIKNNTGAVKEMGTGFADEFVTELAKLGASLAKERTRPGLSYSGIGGGGPGPHPHRTRHWDTGDLMHSIAVNSRRAGFLSTATVSSHMPYALDLEMGWHAPGGFFYRYPWLGPSMQQAAESAEDIAHVTVKRWFGGTWGQMTKGDLTISTPLTWAIGE